MPQPDATWSDWYDQHSRALVLLARQWCRTHEDAEDAVQDAFTNFWPKRATVEDPVAYLYRCTRNAALNRHRVRERSRARERRAAEGRALMLSQTGNSPVFEDHDDRLALEAALQGLSEAQRETIVMKVWGGLTFEQIGTAGNTSPNTVASRYRYGIKALRKALDLEADDE